MKWVDLRVERTDLARALQVLVDYAWQSIATIHVDPNPPAAGPEVEISFAIASSRASLVRDTAFVERLSKNGVTVLASRTREWERR